MKNQKIITTTPILPTLCEQEVHDIRDILESVWGKQENILPLHEPFFSEGDAEYVANVVKQGWVSTAGKEVAQFEAEIAEMLDVEDVLALNSGTSALHLCMEIFGLKNGVGVAVPALSFVATANAISYAGATPHIVEVDEQHGLLDVDALESYLDSEKGQEVKAVITVCLFGYQSDPTPLQALAKKRGLIVIEDAAGAFGTRFNGKALGSDFDATIFSYNGNKILTTGAGGALVCKDQKCLQEARHLANVAKIVDGANHSFDMVGYNYKMPNLNAALGLSQLKRFKEYLHAKKMLRKKYAEVIEQKSLKMLNDPDGCDSNAWLVNLLLEPLDNVEDEETRLKTIIEACQNSGYGVRPVWQPLHQTPMYQSCPRADLTVAESLSRRLVSLPSSVKV